MLRKFSCRGEMSEDPVCVCVRVSPRREFAKFVRGRNVFSPESGSNLNDSGDRV